MKHTLFGMLCLIFCASCGKPSSEQPASLQDYTSFVWQKSDSFQLRDFETLLKKLTAQRESSREDNFTFDEKDVDSNYHDFMVVQTDTGEPYISVWVYIQNNKPKLWAYQIHQNEILIDDTTKLDRAKSIVRKLLTTNLKSAIP